LVFLENARISKNISSPSFAVLTFLFDNHLKARFNTKVYLLQIFRFSLPPSPMGFGIGIHGFWGAAGRVGWWHFAEHLLMRVDSLW